MENAAQKIQELQEKCALQEQMIAELTAKLKWFEEQFFLSRKQRFGPSSEKSDSKQLQLFNEAEKEADPSKAEPAMEEITYRRRKQKGKREEQLKDLPVETIEYRLSLEEQTCPECGGTLHEMGSEVRQELKIIPAQVTLVKHVRYTYACRDCEKEALSTPIITAPMPAPVLPGSLVSPSTMAYVMTGKYVDGLPLYRQEQSLSRLGIDISRQTMANWMIQGATRWLNLLYVRMHKLLLNKEILHADETPVQVLKEPGRKATSKSYMWIYRTGAEEQAIVLYDYQTTRASKHPNRFLNGFKGYLHVDGYSGYHGLRDVTLVGCWAHARRKFDEALNALPPGKKNADVAARHGLEFCQRLFRVERDLKDLSPEKRYQMRLDRSRPVIEEYKKWLDYQRPRMLPKSAFGKAVNYSLNQWEKLNAYLLDGRLKIDNNLAERSIKRFAIGRKNWLFSNTPRGAKASAIIYSIVETAQANGLNPFAYLQFLFERLPNIDINDQNALDELLPWSGSLPPECRKDSRESK